MRTQQQHRAIAFLVNAIRPDWDTPGILRTLDRIDPTINLEAVAHAALTAAAKRRDQTSPAIIAMTGEHWTPCVAERPAVSVATWTPEPDPAPETRCTPERIAELRAQLANLKPPAPRSTHR